MAGQQRLELPEKAYFRIGEVAKVLDLKPHVVRFWQKEFPSIRPERSRTGRFLYTRNTVEHISLIRTLLHEQGYTIQGARKMLRERSRADIAAEIAANEPTPEPPAPDLATLQQLEEAVAELAQARAEGERLAAQLAATEARHARLREVVLHQGERMRGLLSNGEQ